MNNKKLETIIAIHDITNEQAEMLKKYKLDFSYTGGGCEHFSYKVNILDQDKFNLEWLINNCDDYANTDLPRNENDLCSFYLYYGHCSKQTINKISEINISTLNKTVGTITLLENEGFAIEQTCLESGVPKMKALTKKLEKLIKGEK